MGKKKSSTEPAETAVVARGRGRPPGGGAAKGSAKPKKKTKTASGTVTPRPQRPARSVQPTKKAERSGSESSSSDSEVDWNADSDTDSSSSKKTGSRNLNMKISQVEIINKRIYPKEVTLFKNVAKVVVIPIEGKVKRNTLQITLGDKDEEYKKQKPVAVNRNRNKATDGQDEKKVLKSMQGLVDKMKG